MKPTILIYAECRNPKTKGEKKLAINIALSLKRKLPEYEIILSGLPLSLSIYRQLSDRQLSDKELIIDGQLFGLARMEDIDPDTNQIDLYIEVNRCLPCPFDKVKRIIHPKTKILFVGTPKWLGFDLAAFLDESSRRAGKSLPEPLQLPHRTKLPVSFYATGVGSETAGLPRLPDHKNHRSVISDYFADVQYGFIYLKHTAKKDYPAKDVDPREKDIRFIIDYIKLSLKRMSDARPCYFILIGSHQEILTELQVRLEQLKPSVDLQWGIESDKSPSVHFFEKVSAGDMHHLLTHAIPFVAMTGTQSALEAAMAEKVFLYQYLDENQAFVNDFINAVNHEIEIMDAPAAEKTTMRHLVELTMQAKALDKTDKQQLLEMLAKPKLCRSLGLIYQKLVNGAQDRLTDSLIEQLKQEQTDKIVSL